MSKRDPVSTLVSDMMDAIAQRMDAAGIPREPRSWLERQQRGIQITQQPCSYCDSGRYTFTPPCGACAGRGYILTEAAHAPQEGER